MSKIMHNTGEENVKLQYVSTFCPDKLTWITRGLLSTTMLIIFCWWWISWKVSWRLWLWRHCATLPVVCVEIPLFPYILTFKVLHRYDSLFESWYFLDSLSFEWHALNVANTLHSTFQKQYDCCREKYIVFLQKYWSNSETEEAKNQFYFIYDKIFIRSAMSERHLLIVTQFGNCMLAVWLCAFKWQVLNDCNTQNKS